MDYLDAYKDTIVVLGFVLSFLLLGAGFATESLKGGRRPGEYKFLSDFLKLLGLGTLAAAVFIFYLRSRLSILD